MTDYERGVEQASAVYKEVIREYVAENTKLRELALALYKCRDKVNECGTCEDVECPFMHDCRLHDRMAQLVVDA